MTVGHTRLQLASKSTSDEKMLAALNRADEAVQASIRSMRGLMSELHPQVVERGLTPALREYLEQVERDFDLHCALQGGFAHEPAGTVATTIYRIICEAVVNARKHAPGAQLTVDLRDADAGYAIRVTDDGPGFEPDPTGGSPTGHVGLSSMRERAEALGGRWHIQSRPGQGTRVELWIPHSADASTAGVLDPGTAATAGTGIHASNASTAQVL
jgi:signal transduction histidine kinase